MTRAQLDRAAQVTIALFVGGVVIALFAMSVTGAPVPKRPTELTPVLVTGRWDYEWGGFPAGTIWLYADGSYTAIHTPGSQLIYHGTYAVKGDSVTLTEWVTNVELVTISGPQEYRFAFEVKGYPNLVGTSNGHTKVALTNPKR